MSVMQLRCAKTAEEIEVLFWEKTLENSINQLIIYLFRITDVTQCDNKNMNSEQDAPGS